MFSSRRLIVPLFVYLSLLLATAVDAHDDLLQRRDHSNLKRLMKKRSPFPADESIPPVVVGAGIIPTPSSSFSSSSSSSDTASITSIASSTTSSATTTATSGTATTTGTDTDTTTSETSTSTTTTDSTTSTTFSSTSTTSTSTSTSTTPQPTPTLNLTDAPAAAGSTLTVVPTITRTASVDGATNTEVSTLSAAAASSNDSKGATATILIAVAASVGGIAILWTVFRKWKLASSKKFDQRLRPIDWQQPTADDDAIPTHHRANSRASSFRSGSGHSGSSSRAHDPLDHDFTAGPSTVGGYADLARGPSPQPPMQEHLTRGPSFNRGFDNGVPLHHQGFGARDAYDYNSGAPRY